MGATHLLMRTAFLLCSLVLIGPLAGCFGSDEIIVEEANDEPFYPGINDRQFLDWEWNGTYAMVLE